MELRCASGNPDIPTVDRLNKEIEMKRRVIAVALVAAVAGLTAVSTAQACECGGPKPRNCKSGYWWIKDFQAAKRPPLSCKGAKAVMNKWIDYGYLEGESSHRVGYEGWLWKCDSYREPNQVRRYNVYCWSGKKVWRSGYPVSRSLWFTYID
jgi:hypothetical protein